MKMKVLLVTLLGFAGLGSSLALADGGKHHSQRDATTTTSTTTTQCQRAVVFGTAGPQNLVVTVSKSNHDSPFAPGQVITVSVGKSGDTVRVFAGGCVAGSTLTARSALVSGPPQHHGWDHKGTTTTGSTTTTGGTTTS